MPADIDPELFIDAILMRVDDMGAQGQDYLRREFDRVFAAVMAGDIYVTDLTYKDGSSKSERKVEAAPLLAVLTQARKRLAVDENGNSTNPATGAMLTPRLRGFPLGQEYPTGPYPNGSGIPGNYY